ncbi:3434_t:CDS:2, partial [Dentiscutata heterogama]
MNDEDKNLHTIVEIKDEPHNGKKIEGLLLSPNYTYAATWSEEDKSICGWKFNDPLFEFDRSISVNKICEDLNLKTSTTSEKSDNGRIVIVDHKKENKIIKLIMSYLDEPIENYWHGNCMFYDNGDFVLEAFTPRNYIPNNLKFSVKNLSNDSWKINNSIFIEPANFAWNYLINTNETFILLDTYGALTQWKLDKLLFEKKYQLGLNRNLTRFNVINMISIYNEEKTLIVVFFEVEASYSSDIIISVYLTENSLLLSQCEYKKESDLIYIEFISFDEGERLLLFFENDGLEIRDPYNLEQYKYYKDYKPTASSFFKELSNSDEDTEKFKKSKNKKIYAVSDRQILVQDISKKQWIKYLREKLRDYSKIRALPRKAQIEDFLQNVLKEIDENDKNDIDSNIDEEEQTYESKNLLVKWIVIQDNKFNVVVEAKKAMKFDSTEEDWEHVDKRGIYSKYLSDSKQRFVYRCKLLDNGDLAMITSIGLIILTIKPKDKIKDKIKLRYYRGSGFPFNQIYINYIKKKRRDKLDNEDINKYKLFIVNRENIQQLFNEIKNRSLLWPDFKTITAYHEDKNLRIIDRTNVNPFQELITDYINDKMTLSLYGQKLLNRFLKNNNYTMTERLMTQLYTICINKKAEEGKDINLLANIKLLDIVTFKINELSVKYPDLLKQFLSNTSLIPLSTNKDIAIENSSSKLHLQSHGNYSHPYNTSFINKIITRFQTNIQLFYDKMELEKMPFVALWWSGQALINFKWNAYGKYYFLAICTFYSIFMVCFLIVATIGNELSKSTQEQLLIATIILGALHLFFEFRLFIYFPSYWIRNPWNCYLNDSNNPWNLVTTYYSVSQNGSISATLTELPNTSTNIFYKFNRDELHKIIKRVQKFKWDYKNDEMPFISDALKKLVNIKPENEEKHI